MSLKECRYADILRIDIICLNSNALKNLGIYIHSLEKLKISINKKNSIQLINQVASCAQYSVFIVSLKS